jgi:hypothetical protein
MADGPNGSLGAISYINLSINITEMAFQSVSTHDELLGYIRGVGAHRLQCTHQFFLDCEIIYRRFIDFGERLATFLATGILKGFVLICRCVVVSFLSKNWIWP